MFRTRVMPCLLLQGHGLVKTVKFKDPVYVGDPVNTVRIFNEMEVDELILLDIGSTRIGSPIQYKVLEEVASECFMPFTYGGGIRSVEDAQRVFELGAEKVVLNSHVFDNERLVADIADVYGSQAVVVAIDVNRSLLGTYQTFSCGGTKRQDTTPVEWAKRMNSAGAGEILLNAIHRDGTFSGYDLKLIRAVAEAVRIPVIACGGAASVEDFRAAIFEGGASAVAAGSMVVYQGPNRAVLTNFPSRAKLDAALRTSEQ